MVTSQMPAEYGERTGAAINTITKQGTNAFHGSAYGWYINDQLTAANYFQQRDDLEKPTAKRHIAGFSLSGPIVKERLFFFGLLEETYQGKANAVTYPSNPEKSFTTPAVAKGMDMFARADHQLNRSSNAYGMRFLAVRRSALTIPAAAPAGCRNQHPDERVDAREPD